MKFRFIGATDGHVTGSCTHFDYHEKGIQFLVDCGLNQGEGDADALNARPFPFKPSDIKFVLLTHAHIDHCGLLPKLYKEGFIGKVICTKATAKLATASLLDSSKFVSDLYDQSHVGKIRFHYIGENEELDLSNLFTNPTGLFVRYNSTAHILGAMFVTISWVKPNGEVASIVMSGDLGNNTKENPYQPLLNHRKSIQGYPDAIVVESTYGDRLRDIKFASHENRVSELKSIIQSVIFDQKSLLVIPTFSLQRTQEVLLDLYCIFQKYYSNESDCLSPLFIKNPNIQIFENNCWDLETNNMLKNALASIKCSDTVEWENAITQVDKDTFTFTGDAKFTVKDIENLLFNTKQKYPVNIALDSKLSREMSPVFRNELVRRNADDPNTPYWRNPLMMERLGLNNEEEVDDVINKLFPPEPDGKDYGFPMGIHYIKYRENFDIPKNSFMNKYAHILITGGGMCNGGPISKHLEELSTSTLPSVILLNGYMTKGSIGDKLLQISNAQASNSSVPFEFLEIGENKIPVKDFKPKIIQLQGYYSGHADQKGILDFIFNVSDVNKSDQANKKATVFINHGVNSTRKTLKKVVEERNSQQIVGSRQIANVELPADSDQWYDLNEMKWITFENENQTDRYLRQILDEQRQTNSLLSMIVDIQKKQFIANNASYNSSKTTNNKSKKS